jgi:hypothetical protein
MTPLQKMLNALAVFARVRKNDDLAEYLELAAVTAGAVSDDKAQFVALTAEILEKAAAATPLTDAERQAVRDRRHQIADQIAALPVGDGGG